MGKKVTLKFDGREYEFPVLEGEAPDLLYLEVDGTTIRLGAEYHEQFVAQFGGEMTGPQARYVEQVGQNIAVQSGLANSRDAFDVDVWKGVWYMLNYTVQYNVGLVRRRYTGEYETEPSSQ